MIKLKGITWDHARGYDPLVAAAALYEQEFGVTVEWHKRSLVQFGDQSIEALAKQFDLLVIDHPHSGVVAASKCLVALDEVLPEDILSILAQQSAGPSYASYFYQQHQWALPVDAAMQCAAFRSDLINPIAIPQTWNGVLALAKQLQANGQWAGMALCPTDCLCTFLSLTAQFGSPIKEGETQLVQRETGIYCLELMQQLQKLFHPECLQWNPIALYDYMSTENNLVYSPLAFCYTNYARAGFRKYPLQFTTATEINNAVLGGAGIAVAAGSLHINAAADFAQWLCSASVQSSVYVTAQGQPGNNIAWESSYANNITNHFFTQTTASLKGAYVRPRYKGWPAFQEKMGEMIHAFLQTGSDVNKLLDQLEQAYKASYTN